MDFFRRFFRVSYVVILFLLGALELLVTRPKTRPERAAWLSRFAKRLLRCFDLKFSLVGTPPPSGAVLSNHLTFFDILVHSAVRPTVFVSKAELRKTPLLGWMSMMAGTIYVVRGGGGSAAKAAQGMAEGFRDGIPVTFFPEGTTGTGDQIVMPFRSGLIAQTLEAEEPMRAAFVRYDLSERDLAAGHTARQDIHWGTQTLPQLVWAFAGLHELQASVFYAAEPIDFTPQALANRKIAAAEARTAVRALGEQAQASAPK
ncbi:MAG: lysophospholipid acyltransferase family protein [Bryocella sp.]